MIDQKRVRYSFELLGGKVPFEPIRFDTSTTLHYWKAPPGHTKIKVFLAGGAGIGGPQGGTVECILKIKPMQELYICAGPASTSTNIASYNAADIRTVYSDSLTDSDSLQSRIVVAGGAGNNASANGAGAGAVGGGLTAADGITSRCCSGGGGGTQSAGGYAGYGIAWTTQQTRNGAVGTFGMGGNAAVHSGSGGAGGAGWYGGGGGAGGFTKSYGTYGGGGGGGSSYTDPKLCTEVVHTKGGNSSTSYVIISMA